MEETEHAIAKIKELNRMKPILVEGEKDVHALRLLGLNGEILTVNDGNSLVDLCDGIAERYADIILLTDWDKRGGRLANAIEKNLAGRTRCLTEFRALFAHSTMVKDVEGLPSFIHNMHERFRRPQY